MEVSKKSFQALIASEHKARVSLLPMNFTVAGLILYKPVASTSGAHFILKMTFSLSTWQLNYS